MCGLFGGIRVAEGHEAGTSFAEVVLSLGRMAEERGTDSAGIALAGIAPVGKDLMVPEAADLRATLTSFDGTVIVKDAVAFSKLPLDRIRPFLQSITRVAIGHTRWATQGAKSDLANVSPMAIGGVVGTHNGDITPASVPSHRSYASKAFGGTDSEILFAALSENRKDRRGITRVLSRVEGRVATAFLDRARPDRLYLARTAIAPLAYATDQNGNFYYASNPNWFRRVAAMHPLVTFEDIYLIPEGHFLTVNTETGEVENMRRFTPTARERDVQMMEIVAYRAFTKEDRELDLTLHRHRIVQQASRKWPTVGVAPGRLADADTDDIVDADVVSVMDARMAAEEPEAWDTRGEVDWDVSPWARDPWRDAERDIDTDYESLFTYGGEFHEDEWAQYWALRDSGQVTAAEHVLDAVKRAGAEVADLDAQFDAYLESIGGEDALPHSLTSY